MNERWLAMLRVLAEADEPLNPGRAAYIAFGKAAGRPDATGRNILQALQRRGLVAFADFWHDTWTITDEGRRALEEAPPCPE